MSEEKTTNETTEVAEKEAVVEETTQDNKPEEVVAENTAVDDSDSDGDDISGFDATSWIEGFADEELQGIEEDEQAEAVAEVEEEEVEPEPIAEEKEEPAPVDDLNRPDMPEREMTIWEKFAQDVGINAESYPDLLEKIKSQDTVVREDETLARISKLNNMDDEALYRAYLSTKVTGEEGAWTKEKVERRVDLAKDKGELEFLVDDIREDLSKKKQQYLHSIKAKQNEADAKRKNDTEQFTANLTDSVSKTKELYDGNYNFTQEDKEKVLDFITKGDFQKAIVGDANTLIEAALFIMNRNKVVGLLQNNGKTEGTRAALSKLRPVESNKRNFAIPDKSTGPYVDANKFLAGLDKPGKEVRSGS